MSWTLANPLLKLHSRSTSDSSGNSVLIAQHVACLIAVAGTLFLHLCSRQPLGAERAMQVTWRISVLELGLGLAIDASFPSDAVFFCVALSVKAIFKSDCKLSANMLHIANWFFTNSLRGRGGMSYRKRAPLGQRQ
jgi:hypothetical protein